MNEELRFIGEMFRTKRKELNLTLKEVENTTSIRAPYLEAIEEGRIAEFISSVYALGFIKQYASFLEIDIEKIISEHPVAFQMPGEKHDFAYGIGTLEKRGATGGGVKGLPNIVWALGAALLLVIGWYLARYLGIF